jgi:hypothetical protein
MLLRKFDLVKAFRKEEEVFLKGIIKWCKHIKPDMTFPPGKWSVQMYIEGLELEKVRMWQAEGIKNSVKHDNDGWYITLSRKCSLTTRDGKVRGLEPPFVFTMEGENKIPVTTLVGNGSTGVAKCHLWRFNPEPHIKGTAVRWESLRVDNLIPYDPDKDMPPMPDGRSMAEHMTGGLDAQEPLF